MTSAGAATKGGLIALLATTVLLAATPAGAAHKPYLLPFTFSPERDYVGVEGAMVEDRYFMPDFAIRGTGDWIVTGPDGVAKPLTPMNLKSINIADVALPTEGTYRIGTGERPGRVGKFAKVDGVWRSVREETAAPRPPEARPPGAPAAPPRPEQPGRGPGPIIASELPAGVEMAESRSFLIAETYVSRGAPTPVKATGKGFEILPVTHPNEIYLDDGFSFQALVDGQPVADLTVTIFRGGEGYDSSQTVIEARTDAQGKATLKFAKPGVYLLNTRYPAQTPPGAAPSPKSWTYGLTFEVTP